MLEGIMKNVRIANFAKPSLTLEESDVQEFRQIYKKHTGLLISKDKARKKLAMIVRQMELIYQPIKAQDLAELEGKGGSTKM